MLQRAAIVLLVVLNLGAAAWWLLHAAPAPEAPVETPPGAARLRLVAESSPEAQAVAAQASSAQRSSAQGGSAQDSTATRNAAPSGAAPAAGAPGPAAACEGGDGPASGWRVWLPALASADAAQATAARIGESGFSDYVVVRDGADANAIALGRYGTEQAAQRRTAALRAAGFPARCARIPQATPA